MCVLIVCLVCHPSASPNRVLDVWMDLNDLFTEGEFKWGDNTPLDRIDNTPIPVYREFIIVF